MFYLRTECERQREQERREVEGDKEQGSPDAWLFIVVRGAFIYHVCNHFSLGFVAEQMLLAAVAVADSVTVAAGMDCDTDSLLCSLFSAVSLTVGFAIAEWHSHKRFSHMLENFQV